MVTLVCFMLPIIIQAIVPIPHTFFIPMFEKRLKIQDGVRTPADYIMLNNALEIAKEKLSGNGNA